MIESQFVAQAESWAKYTPKSNKIEKNDFLGYEYASAEEAKKANALLRSAFTDPHPGFGTQFGPAGKALLVRVVDEAGLKLAERTLGVPAHKRTLSLGPAGPK